MRRPGRDDDCIDGERLAKIMAAVAMLQRDIAQLQRLQVPPRLGDQRSDALDAVHVAGDVREHRGLVAAAGADLEHFVELAAVARKLAHPRDDPRLRYRLAVADRKRRVVIRADGERLVDEDVARHAVQCREHDFVGDALLAQPLDHPRARTRRRHPDAGALPVVAAERPHRPCSPD